MCSFISFVFFFTEGRSRAVCALATILFFERAIGYEGSPFELFSRLCSTVKCPHWPTLWENSKTLASVLWGETFKFFTPGIFFAPHHPCIEWELCCNFWPDQGPKQEDWEKHFFLIQKRKSSKNMRGLRMPKKGTPTTKTIFCFVDRICQL